MPSHSNKEINQNMPVVDCNEKYPNILNLK